MSAGAPQPSPAPSAAGLHAKSAELLAGQAGDEERFLRRSLIACSMAVLIIVATTQIYTHYLSARDIPPLLRVWLAYTAMAICLVAAAFNRARLGWIAFLALGFVLLMANAFDSGGLFAAQWIGAGIMVLAAGRFVHPAASVVMAGAFIAAALVFSQLHSSGAVPESALQNHVQRRLMTVMQFLVLSGVVAWYIYRNHRQQVRALRDAKAHAEFHARSARIADQRMQRVFDESPVAMAIFALRTGRIDTCNAAYLRLVERPMAEVVGRTGAELDLWLDPDRRGQLHARFRAGEKISDEPFDVRVGRGRVKHCVLSWHRLDIEGEPFVLSSLLDVTERVVATEKLVENERRFQDLAHAAGDWFWETDQDGRLSWVSDSVESVLDVQPSALLGLPYGEIEHFGFIEFAAAGQQLSDAGERRVAFRDVDARRVHRGTVQWLRFSGAPRMNATGQFLGYRGACVDITERRNAQSDALLAGQRLRVAVEHLDELFVLCDRNDQIVQANQQFHELMGPKGLGLPDDSTYEDCFRAAVKHGRLRRPSGVREQDIVAALAARRRGDVGLEFLTGDDRWLMQSNRCIADGSIITTAIDISGLKRHESLLAASEARLRQILDLTPAVAVQEFDEQGRILYWNRASTTLYGYSADEALGRTVGELFWTPAEADRWLQDLRNLKETGQAIGPLEGTIRRKNNEQRSILFTSFAVHSTEGAPRFVCMDIDITDRKLAEDKLRANQTLLETVIDAIPMSVFVKDLQSTYLLVNAAFASFHGIERSSIVGRSTRDLPAPDETKRKSLMDDQRVFETGEVYDQAEAQLQDPSGRYVPFHSLKLPLRDAQGSVVGLVGINRNLTQDKAAQEQLRASEARFSALFHKSLVPQIVSNPASRETDDVNQAFVDMIGYPREVLLGPRVHEVQLFWSEEDDALVGRITAEGGTSGPVDVHARRADGSHLIVSCSAFRIETSTGTRIAWSLVDVTAQRELQQRMAELNLSLEAAVNERTERLRQTNQELQATLARLQDSQEALIHSEKLASLGRLVAGVSHELNTPIGNSLLMSTTLSDETSRFRRNYERGELRRAELAQFVETCTTASDIVQRNLARASELIRSFKQVAVDQSSSVRRRFALREVIDEVLLAHRPLLKQHTITVEHDSPSDIALDSFPGPLGQVLGNLLTNAVSHAFDGRADGCIQIQSSLNRPDEVTIVFTDNGAGIESRNLKRIFDPFFTTRLGRGGTGLGLNIVHTIVTGILGGSIRVTSQVDIGTIFTLRLPVVAPNQDPNALPP